MTYERVMVRFAVVLGAVLAACVLLTTRASARIVACPPSVTAPATLPTAELNSPYTYPLPGCGASWSLTGTLPTGLTFDAPSHTISGTPTGSVSTASLTVTATSSGTDATENVELPVAETVQVDPAKGELTGVTYDTSAGNLINLARANTPIPVSSSGLVYVAGPTAGKVFDIDPTNPESTGTAMSGLTFPAAVATGFNLFSFGQGLLYAAQFGSPPASGEPLAVATTPTDTSSPSALQAPLSDGDTSCAKPDAATTPSFLPFPLVAYSCAGSDQVTVDVLAPICIPDMAASCSFNYNLGPNGVPSGMAFDNNLDLLIADARNNTVTAVNGAGSPDVVVDLPAGSTPANVAYDPNNNILYVADPGTDQVSRVSVGTDTSGSTPVTTLTDTGEINLPPGCRPFGVAVDNTGNTVVATCSGAGTAQVIDVSGSTPTIAYSPQVGSVPDGVTIVGNDAFVANEVGGTVTVIDPPAGARALHAQVAVTHARRHGSHLVRRGQTALHSVLKQIKKASHGKRVTNLHALLKQIQRASKRHKHRPAKRHHRAAAHGSAASVADPLVAPLSPFSR
jgi:DNA-binding beta-propeller fold protein YncE